MTFMNTAAVLAEVRPTGALPRSPRRACIARRGPGDGRGGGVKLR
jgi:hypothetical protein